MKPSPKYLLGAVFIGLAAFFFWFIARHTIQLIFWDQWDVVERVLTGKIDASFFLVTHNEHRIGTGLVVTRLLAGLTSWNNLAETYFIGLIIAASCLLALRLSWLRKGGWSIYDVGIPLIFFSLQQHENLTWGFQIAFVFPLLWLMLSLVLLASPTKSRWRDGALLLISLLSTYSSFQGMFLPLLIALYYGLGMVGRKRWSALNGLYLGLQLLIAASYFFQFNWPARTGETASLLVSVNYSAILISYFLTYHRHTILLAVFPLTIVGSLAYLVWQAVKKDGLKNFPLIALFLYGLLFCVSAAYGRAGLGLDQALSSRYTTFLIPLYLGLLLFGQTLEIAPKLKRRLLAVLVVVLLLANVNAARWALRSSVVEGRAAAWGTCYLLEQDAISCERNTQFQVYPDLVAGQIEARLQLLREHGDNLFR